LDGLFSVVEKTGVVVLIKSSSSAAWRIVVDDELMEKLEQNPQSPPPPLDTLGSLVSIINEEAIPLNEKKLSSRRSKETQ
jgi:hypothetical protein